jgi:hypothetical protein
MHLLRAVSQPLTKLVSYVQITRVATAQLRAPVQQAQRAVPGPVPA